MAEDRAASAALPVRADGKGRRWKDSRRVLDGIRVLDGVLGVSHTGAPWKSLPRGEYPPCQTCRRSRRWVKDDTLKNIVHAFAQQADLDLSECFTLGGTFAPAKKGLRRRQDQHPEGTRQGHQPAKAPS